MLATGKYHDQLRPVDEIKQLTDAVLRFRDARDQLLVTGVHPAS